jgi:ketosteroid isomerase-like protein
MPIVASRVVRGRDGKMTEQLRNEIEKANRRFGEGIRKGDAAAVGTLYTKDALLMPPNFEAIRGREGTQKFWEGAIKMGVKDAILKTEELHEKGETVEEIGNYTLKIHPEGQDPFEDRGKYVVLWKQDSDKEWRLHRDIWNSSLPAKK